MLQNKQQLEQPILEQGVDLPKRKANVGTSITASMKQQTSPIRSLSDANSSFQELKENNQNIIINIEKQGSQDVSIILSPDQMIEPIKEAFHTQYAKKSVVISADDLQFIESGNFGQNMDLLNLHQSDLDLMQQQERTVLQQTQFKMIGSMNNESRGDSSVPIQSTPNYQLQKRLSQEHFKLQSQDSHKKEIVLKGRNHSNVSTNYGNSHRQKNKNQQNGLLPNINVKIGHNVPPLKLPVNMSPQFNMSNTREKVNQRYRSPQAPRAGSSMFSPYSSSKADAQRPTVFENTKLRASSNSRPPQALSNPFISQTKMAVQGRQSQIINKQTAAMNSIKNSIQFPQGPDQNTARSMSLDNFYNLMKSSYLENEAQQAVLISQALDINEHRKLNMSVEEIISIMRNQGYQGQTSPDLSVPGSMPPTVFEDQNRKTVPIFDDFVQRSLYNKFTNHNLLVSDLQKIESQNILNQQRLQAMQDYNMTSRTLKNFAHSMTSGQNDHDYTAGTSLDEPISTDRQRQEDYMKQRARHIKNQKLISLQQDRGANLSSKIIKNQQLQSLIDDQIKHQAIFGQKHQMSVQQLKSGEQSSMQRNESEIQTQQSGDPKMEPKPFHMSDKTLRKIQTSQLDEQPYPHSQQRNQEAEEIREQRIVLNKDMITVGTNQQLTEMDQLPGVNEYPETAYSPKMTQMGLFSNAELDRTDQLLPWNVKISSKNQHDIQKSFGATGNVQTSFESAKMSFQNPYIQQKVLNGPSVLGTYKNFARENQQTDGIHGRQVFNKTNHKDSPTFTGHFVSYQNREQGKQMQHFDNERQSQQESMPNDKETNKFRSTQRSPQGGFEAATSTSFKSLGSMIQVTKQNRKTPVQNRQKQKVPTLNEPLYGVSEAFNKTYLDLTRRAEKMSANQIDMQRELLSREFSKSVLVGAEVRVNQLPQKALDKPKYMKIESSTKSRPWIDHSMRMTTRQDIFNSPKSHYFGSSTGFRAGATSLLENSLNEPQKLYDLLNIKSGSMDLHASTLIATPDHQDSSSESLEREIQNPAAQKKNPFKYSTDLMPKPVSFERQVSNVMKKQYQKKSGLGGLEQRKQLREIKKSLQKRKNNAEKLVMGNIQNTRKYQTQLKYYENLHQRQSSVSHQQGSAILASMKLGALSLAEQNIVSSLLPDIEARKSRLARLNQLSLLKQGSPREETLERKSPVGHKVMKPKHSELLNLIKIQDQKSKASSPHGSSIDRKDAVRQLIREANQRVNGQEQIQNMFQDFATTTDGTISKGPSPNHTIQTSARGVDSIEIALKGSDFRVFESQEQFAAVNQDQSKFVSQDDPKTIDQRELPIVDKSGNENISYFVPPVRKKNTALEVIMSESIDAEDPVMSQHQILTPAKQFTQQIKIFPQNSFQQAESQKDLQSFGGRSSNQQSPQFQRILRGENNLQELPSAFQLIQGGLDPKILQDSPTTQGQSPYKLNQESPARLIKKTLSKLVLQDKKGFRSRSLISGKYRSQDSYGQLEWTFLDNNATHYRSVFNQAQQKHKNQFKKPNFTTSARNYQSNSPAKQRLNEQFETDQENLINEDKVAQMFQKYLESIGTIELEEQLQYFMDQGADKDQLIRRDLGMHIQYGIHRSKVGLSEIPLSLIFNEKVDQIKKFERLAGREVAPIQLALLDNFNNGPPEGLPPGAIKGEELSIASIKCGNYGLDYNHIFENCQHNASNGLFLSDLERTQLIRKADKYAKTVPFIQENLEQIQHNLQKKPDSQFSQITRHIPAPKSNKVEGEEEGEQIILQNFEGLTGKEPNHEIQLTMKERQRNLPEAYIKLIKQSKLFNQGSVSKQKKDSNLKSGAYQSGDIDQSIASPSPVKVEKQLSSKFLKKHQHSHSKMSPESSPGLKSAFSKQITGKKHFDHRLVHLTMELIRKSAHLKEDKDIPKDQQKERMERIKALTHELYKQFQLEVLQPSTEYLINNNKSYYKLYDEEKRFEIENRPMAEKIGLNLTTQTQVIGQAVNYGIYDLKAQHNSDQIDEVLDNSTRIKTQTKKGKTSQQKQENEHNNKMGQKQPTTEWTLVEQYIKQSHNDPKYDFNNQKNREQAIRTMRGSVLNEVDRFKKAIKTKVILKEAKQINESQKNKKVQAATETGTALKNILLGEIGELVKENQQEEQGALKNMVGKFQQDEELKQKQFHILNPTELMQRLYLK